MRRLELVATDNIPIFDATSALQWISFCAEAAPIGPGASLFLGVTRTYLPRRGFQRVEYLRASSARRKPSASGATDTASRRANTSSAVYCRKHVRAESIVGALCNQAPPISHKNGYVGCGYVGHVDASSALLSTSPCHLRLCSGYGAGSERVPALYLVDDTLRLR